LFAGVSIAVAWHRRLLLGELPGPSGSNVVTRSLWRYVGVGIVICLIVGLPTLAILVAMFRWWVPPATGGIAGQPSPATVPVILLLYLAATAVMLRLSLLLPARAVADLNLTLKETWNRSRGNTWRIFWGLAACMLPPILVAEMALLVLFGFPNPMAPAGGTMAGQWVVSSMMFVSYSLLILPISIGFLSHAYRHFFRQG
jgi:hypothetical protein